MTFCYYVEADSCAVTVAVRVRPFAQREIADPRNRRVVSMEGCETIVRATGTCSLNIYFLGYKQANFADGLLSVKYKSDGLSSALQIICGLSNIIYCVVYRVHCNPLIHMKIRNLLDYPPDKM